MACVAAFAHICWFMAGASVIGAAVARHSVLSRSSARPAASRAMKSALAGATSTRSAQRASSMCPIAASAAESHRLSRTGRPESAWKVVAPMNSRAAAVMTVDTALMGTMFMSVIFMIAMMDYSELKAGLGQKPWLAMLVPAGTPGPTIDPQLPVSEVLATRYKSY